MGQNNLCVERVSPEQGAGLCELTAELELFIAQSPVGPFSPSSDLTTRPLTPALRWECNSSSSGKVV